MASNLPDYIAQILAKNDLVSTKDVEMLTYDDFISKKKMHKVLQISEQIKELMRNPALNRKIPSELEDEFIMTYLNSFKIYENIYYYIRDLFFN